MSSLKKLTIKTENSTDDTIDFFVDNTQIKIYSKGDELIDFYIILDISDWKEIKNFIESELNNNI